MTTDASRYRVRLKYLARIEMGQSPPSTQYSSSSEDGLPFLQGTADFGAARPTPRVYCGSPTKLASAGDILFSVRAPVGDLNLAAQEFGIGRGLCAIRPQQHWAARFAWWALHEARHQLNLVSTGSTYDAVAIEDVGNLLVETTAPGAQRGIADYLDRETARLDALVAAKERVLGLLAEKRRALITRAVTRGLDPCVPLRDSGIPWLGKIPVHWKVVQLKFASTSLQTGPFGSQLHSEDYVTGGTPVVNPSHLAGGRIHADGRVSVDEATADRLAVHRLSLGDVVFARRGEMGRCGVAEVANVGWLCGTGSLRARLRKDSVVPYYLALVFAETGISDVLAVQSVGSTMDNLNTEILGGCHVPMPPLEEQHTIVDHVDRETVKLDAIRTATARTIALLKERRAALIAAAVTGQIDLGRAP